MPMQIPPQDFATQIKVPDMLDTMSRITALQNAQQQLKTNQLSYQVADTANQKMNRLRDIAADPSMRNDDGSYNQQKFADTSASLGPDSQAAQTSALALQGKGIFNQNAQLQLQGAHKEAADAQVAGLAANPHFIAAADPNTPAQDMPMHVDAMGKAIKSAAVAMNRAGVPLDQILERYDAAMGHVQNQPQTFAQALIDTNNQRLSGSALIAANQPGYVDNGQQLSNPNPMMPNAQPVQKQLPPTTPVYDPVTNAPGYLGPKPAAVQSQQGGQPPAGGAGPQGLDVRNMSTMQQQFLMRQDPAAFARGVQHFQQTSQAPQQPAMPPTKQDAQPPVQSGPPLDTSELMMSRAAANQAAASVGDSRSNNAQIKEVLKNTANDFLDPTGKGASYIQGLASRMGFAVGGDAASNYNSIAHNLALQQQTRNQQMGVKTDAGSAISAISSGSPEQDRKTLSKAVNISEAGNTGIEMFNQGMEAAIKSGGLPAVRDFKNAWSQNYDVNALRLANAHANGDKQEMEDVIKLLGGKHSPQFNLARQHAANLEALHTGQIPRGSN